MSFSNKKKKTQEGYALILAIFVAAFFITMTALTSQYTLGTLKNTKAEFQKVAQAKNVAEAGLQDAAFWFESQPSFTPATVVGTGIWCDGGTGGISCISGVLKSVSSVIPAPLANHLAFRPTIATSTISRGDTDDSRGIVRDILIDKQNNLYGHYEVLRYDPNKWLSATNDQNLNTAAMDISDEKGTTLDALGNNTQVGKARYWRLVSTGVLYRRKPEQMGINTIGVFTTPYTDCDIIGKYTLSENLLKIKYDNPQAAIVLNKPAQFTSYSNSILNATSTTSDRTVLCDDSGTLPTAITANPNTNGVKGLFSSGLNGAELKTGFTFDTSSVFGVTEQEIKGIANQRANTLTQLKRDSVTGRFGSAEIIYLEGTGSTTFTFGATAPAFPLKGGGILYVKNANLNLANMGNSLFNGVIYVKDGNLTIGGLNSVSGSIYVEKGNLDINGGSEKADIGYNQRVIDNIITNISRYKEDSLSYKSISVK